MSDGLWDQWRAFVVPNMGIIEIGMTFFLVIGFCIYQIWSTDRELKRDRQERLRKEKKKEGKQVKAR